MAAGEVASRLAVRTLVNLVLDTPDWIMRVEDEEGDRVLERILRRYREVDAALKEEARADPDHFLVIDASGDEAGVFGSLLDALEQRLSR